MGLKTLANKATAKVGRQMLTVQKHSPTLLIGVGVVGVITSTVLACRATLKLSETLSESEEHLKRVEKDVIEEADSESEKKAAHFGVQLKLATKIARLYVPAVIIGVASIGAIAGSHVILKRRNAALVSAYTIVHKSFEDYRNRVIADQGKEKDLEYRFGKADREIVEEGPNGPEVRTIKGLDQEASKANEEHSYARVFDETNKNWSPYPHENDFFVQSMLNHARDMLQVNGFVFLSDVYDLLGFERTAASQVVGWVKKAKINPETGEQMNDGFIDFGVWNNGVYKGKEWVNGNVKAIQLDFNVDGPVLDILPKM